MATKYSAETRDKTLALVKELEGNVSEAARRMDISRATIQRWMAEENDDDPLAAIERLLMQKITKIIDAMDQHLEKASVADKARAVGILTDRLARLRQMRLAEDKGEAPRENPWDLLEERFESALLTSSGDQAQNVWTPFSDNGHPDG